MLHRDIKPSNILVGKHGETLMVDWGLAKPTGQSEPARLGRADARPSSASGSAETLPGQRLGTPAYMSPEQAEGDLDRLGPASDVYSLGATLYCLLTGRPPFEGDVGRRDPRRAAGRVPPAAPRRPRDRPGAGGGLPQGDGDGARGPVRSCRALADDIERWMADEPVSAWREPFSRRARRWARRHRTAVPAAPVALWRPSSGWAPWPPSRPGPIPT